MNTEIRMAGRPMSAKKAAQLNARAARDVAHNVARQIREYGANPETDILVLEVEMMDRSIEWHAYGQTHPEAMKAAGYDWSQRGYWWAATPKAIRIDGGGVKFVHRDGSQSVR